MPEIFEVTVRSGEDICKTISDFVTAHGWQNVMIPAAIGSGIGRRSVLAFMTQRLKRQQYMTRRQSCFLSPERS